MARSTSNNSWEGVEQLAQEAGAKWASLVAAQWALESGWGKHMPGNNAFGLKGKGQNFVTTEVINGKTVVMPDDFLVFDSLGDCVQHLVSRWYLDYKQHKGVNRASSVEAAARELQKQGYATNPRYAERLIELVHQHGSKTQESKKETPLLWIKATQDTWLKKTPKQATELEETERMRVVAGRIYGVDALTELPADSHSCVELSSGAGSWYVYGPHWELVQKGRLVETSSGGVNWGDFGSLVTPSLTVGEVLQWDKRRVPAAGSGVERRILATAEQFQRVRDAWGQPIGVTSLYRPEPINAAVGGVAGSRHVSGEAMDVYPVNRSMESFYQWIRVRWSGGLGDGRHRGFIHLDTAGGGGFVPGAGVRPRREWTY